MTNGFSHEKEAKFGSSNELLKRDAHYFEIFKRKHDVYITCIFLAQHFNFSEKGKTRVLFVKNLSYSITGETLKDAFDGAQSARIASFPDTGRSRG